MQRFQRARRPEQKEVRRRAILRAARDLAREVGPVELGLNEIGRRSGVSKPNIYRYFESREEILLRLYVDELGDLVESLERYLRPGQTIGEVALIVSTEHTSRPLLCQLAGILASVLEHNVTVETLVSVKRELAALFPRAVAAFQRGLPWLSDGDAAFAIMAIEHQLASLWPAAHPSSVAREVQKRPEFAVFRTDIDRDLRRFIDVLLVGFRASTVR